MDLRPSDIAQAQADMLTNLLKGFQGGGGDSLTDTFINLAIREKQQYRVNAINSGLVTMEEFWQKEAEDFTKPHKIAQGVGPTMAASVEKNLGAMSQEEVIAEHEKAVKALADSMQRSTSDPQIKQQLLANLGMGAVKQQEKLMGMWRAAAEVHQKVVLDELTQTQLDQVKELGVEGVKGRIAVRLGEMVAAGMNADVAHAYLNVVETQAQTSWASVMALEVMEKEGLPAGEKWLKENTPFWNGNPEVRLQVLQNVRQEWEKQGGIKDAEIETTVNKNYYDSRQSIPMLQEGLNKLGGYRWHDATVMHKWQEWYENQIAQVSNQQAVKSGTLREAFEDAQKEAGARTAYALQLAIAKNAPASVLSAMIEQTLHPSQDSPWPPITYEKATELAKIVNGIQPYGLKEALRRVQDKKLPLTQQTELGVRITQFVTDNPQATDAEILQAAENMITGTVSRIKDRAWAGLTPGSDAEVQRNRDAVRLGNIKKMTEDIQANKYRGLTAENANDLNIYAAYLLDYAQRNYPAIRFIAASPDTTGETAENPGAAILLDGRSVQYRFKMENGELVLYGLYGLRGNAQEKSWQPVAKPKKTVKPKATPLTLEEEAEKRLEFSQSHQGF